MTKKLTKLYPALIAGLGLSPLVAGAEGDAVNSIIVNISATLRLIIGALFVIATVIFLWGVIQFIAKSGDEAGRQKAKGIMTWGIVGLAVMAAAWGIVQILTQYFGIPSGPPSFIQPPTFVR